MKLSSVKKSSVFYKKIERLKFGSYSFEEAENFLINSDNCNNLTNGNIEIEAEIENNNDEEISVEKGSESNINFSKFKEETKKSVSNTKITTHTKNSTCYSNNFISNDNNSIIEHSNLKERNEVVSYSEKIQLTRDSSICNLSNKNDLNLTNDLNLKKKKSENMKKVLKKISNPISRAMEKYRLELRRKAAEYCWVHVSCALWNPLIIINDFENKEDIKSKYFKMLDIESIDIQKFNEICMICNKAGQGPVLKCENPKCTCQFHVECARINKYHLECFLTEEGFKYYIYCHTHRPLEFLKNLEFKNQKKVEDILKFAEIIEKYLEATNKNNNNKISCFTKTFSLAKSTPMYLKFLNKKRGKLNGKGEKDEKNEKNEQSYEKLNKQQMDKVLSKVREIYNKIISLDVPIKYREKSNKYEILKDPAHLNLTYNFKNTFDKNIFPWHLVNIPGIPIKLAYMNYGQVINCEAEFKKYILLKNDVIPKICNTAITSVDDDKEYCYCKSNNTDNSYMIACSNEDCEYNGWFHPSCCPETSGKSKEEIESEDFEFTCESCRLKLKANIPDQVMIKDDKNSKILSFTNSPHSNHNNNSNSIFKSRGTTLEDCTWTDNNNSQELNYKRKPSKDNNIKYDLAYNNEINIGIIDKNMKIFNNENSYLNFKNQNSNSTRKSKKSDFISFQNNNETPIKMEKIKSNESIDLKNSIPSLNLINSLMNGYVSSSNNNNSKNNISIDIDLNLNTYADLELKEQEK